jgi:hypothetical protein
MDAQKLAIQNRMYQYSRAIYRSIKDLIEPHVPRDTQLEYRRAVLAACEDTMERLARDPLYFSRPERSLFQDIRRYFPRPAPSTGASRAAGRRPARASRASAPLSPSGSTARAISISLTLRPKK